jgi:tetratricopeptide (TPR) repeat protein
MSSSCAHFNRHILLRYAGYAAIVVLFTGNGLVAAPQTAPAKKPLTNAAESINESYHFLKDREPAMKESELALYERIVPMIFSKPDLAINLLERMIKDKEVESPAFDFALGNVYFNAGRTKEAEEHYRQAVQKYPQFLRAWVNLGILYYQQDKFETAVDCFSKANTLGAPDAERLGMMAYCLRQLDNPVAAEAAYMQAMTIDPRNVDWTEGLVSIYLDDKDWGRAEKMLKYLLSLQPNNARNWKIYAWVLDTTGRSAEAMGYLDVAESRGILDADGLLQLGDMRRELGLIHEAADAYRKAALGNETMGTQRLLDFSSYLIEDKRLDEAESVLAKVPANLSDEIRIKAFTVRARLFLARGNTGEALNELLAAERIGPLDGNVQMILGQTYEALDKPERAIIAYETAARQADFRRQASLSLANLTLKQGDYAASIRHIRDALAVKDEPQLREYLAQVLSYSDKISSQSGAINSPKKQK